MKTSQIIKEVQGDRNCNHEWVKAEKETFVTDTENKTWLIKKYLCQRCLGTKKIESHVK